MNMQKIYYDMAEKLRPYAEPHMDKLCKKLLVMLHAQESLMKR
ncbi:hypothetical protein HMPREF1584_01008 [Gardnerella vaginalis JCP8481A]|uniref:Uncharacterized protein n=1 Tax=Gardnerella vaginalis TaxID=2702 RepID=A0A133NTL6_GARVA|nr:hypothetical protein HMPREF1584_01008 [Gardnerella vaginalis JCP8481A]EPI44264.1 hypothetical protein HMPREF1585_00139 [Gardnerella vaginalis JCP8481B]KXA19621.1 hypothetical protein HMPREF3208_01033 [Gardnerella vaginalis]